MNLLQELRLGRRGIAEEADVDVGSESVPARLLKSLPCASE